MKFLIFNAVVAAALIYLFNGNDWGNDWSLQRLTGISLSSPAQPEAKTPTPKAAPIPKAAPMPKTAPVPKPAPLPKVAAGKSAAPTAPTPLPAAVAKRRAAVLAPLEAAVDETGLQSRLTRRKSLLSLAEEMELFAVEASAR